MTDTREDIQNAQEYNHQRMWPLVVTYQQLDELKLNELLLKCFKLQYMKGIMHLLQNGVKISDPYTCLTAAIVGHIDFQHTMELLNYVLDLTDYPSENLVEAANQIADLQVMDFLILKIEGTPSDKVLQIRNDLHKRIEGKQ